MLLTNPRQRTPLRDRDEGVPRTNRHITNLLFCRVHERKKKKETEAKLEAVARVGREVGPRVGGYRASESFQEARGSWT